MNEEAATDGVEQGNEGRVPAGDVGEVTGASPLLADANGDLGSPRDSSDGEMKTRLQEVKAHYHHGSVSAGTLDELERHADPRLRWVEGQAFSGCVAGVLCLDMLSLWYETDHPEKWWLPRNICFLTFFATEFVLRLLHYRSFSILCQWRTSVYRWIAYDGLVVLLGLLDVAVVYMVCELSCAGVQADLDIPERHYTTGAPGLLNAPLSPELYNHVRDMSRHHPAEPPRHPQLGRAGGDHAFLLRALRLSRLLRLVRIIRMNAALQDFVGLLTEMLQTFAWILSIMFLILFVTAIILTRLIGHGLAVRTNDPELLQELHQMFATIPTTLFTLFQLTTADDWARIAMPLVAVNPWWRLFFIFFITFMSWTMLSLLTAVASETMITESRKQKEVDMKIQSMENRGVVTYLCEKFVQADEDKTNTLDKEEFIKLMSEESMRQKLKDHGMHFDDERDIEKYWKTFDIDDSGELTIDELVHGFSVLQEGLETKHVAKIGYALKSFHNKIETDFEGMEGSIDQLAAQQEEVLKRLLVQQEFYKTQWTMFWQQDGGEEAPAACSSMVVAGWQDGNAGEGS